MRDANPEEFCCEGCFQHSWLRAVARESHDATGVCFYCGNAANLARVARFRNGFENLLSDYIPAGNANGGRDSYLDSVPTIDAIQRDWKLFSSDCSPERRNRFLPSVFNADHLPRVGALDTLVVPFHRNAMSTAYGRWLQFWFIDPKDLADWGLVDPAVEIDTIGSWGQQQAEHLKYFVRSLAAGVRLWRARSDYAGSSEWDCGPLPISQMGHNPKCPASRLNRDGEAVLYTAEAERTALAEIRPGRGNICTTCEIETIRVLKVLDLASPLAEINPFTQDQLSWQLDLRRIAMNLSARIAQPTSRGEDSFIYGRTQYLAKLTRAMKLDGIRFSSSLDSPHGVNIAIFDTEAVRYADAHLVKITSTEILYNVIEPQKLASSR